MEGTRGSPAPREITWSHLTHTNAQIFQGGGTYRGCWENAVVD